MSDNARIVLVVLIVVAALFVVLVVLKDRLKTFAAGVSRRGFNVKMDTHPGGTAKAAAPRATVSDIRQTGGNTRANIHVGKTGSVSGVRQVGLMGNELNISAGGEPENTRKGE
jgi:hypothetical protein